MNTPLVLNSDGSPITLTERETRLCNALQRQVNDLGYNFPISVLTTVIKKVAQQKFYTIPFAEYLPVVVGEGAWSDIVIQPREFSTANSFEAGIIGLGGQNARINAVEAGIDTVAAQVYTWAKEITVAVPEIESGNRFNWSIIEAKERARKRNWDLGLQKVAFLGLQTVGTNNTAFQGLLNQSAVTVDTTTIPKLISAMSSAELAVLCATLLANYRKQVNYTIYPDRFIVPEYDYNGMATQSSPTFPIKSIKEVLEETFKTITMNPNFKILPLAYANNAGQGGGVGANYTYALYSSNDESLRMTLPVDYTPTAMSTLNGFQFQNVAYGQFTGVQLINSLSMVYYQHA